MKTPEQLYWQNERRNVYNCLAKANEERFLPGVKIISISCFGKDFLLGMISSALLLMKLVRHRQD